MKQNLTQSEQSIHEVAMQYARSNKKRIAKEKVDYYPKEEKPISVFMAGSPGAGKTESAKSLIKQLGDSTLHLDNDELREEFEDYTGDNSNLFQTPATLLLEALHDRALKRGVSFVLDTTLASYDKAKTNIERSLKKDREIIIIFVYQTPKTAWEFVKAREKVEGRRVPEEVFVRQFLSSQNVVNKLKLEFGKDIVLHLLIKNIDGSSKNYYANVDNIHHYLKEQFTENDLLKIVNIQGD